MPKTLAVGQILTTKEMKEAVKLYKTCETHRFSERCASEIIGPVIERINKTTGQENDPTYLAYCVEYALMKSQGNLHA